MKYVATSTQIIAAIADIAPTVNVVGAGALGVTSVEPNRITLRGSSPVLLDVRVTFTTLENNGVTLVTHQYADPNVRAGSPVDNGVREIYTKLSTRFQMTP